MSETNFPKQTMNKKQQKRVSYALAMVNKMVEQKDRAGLITSLVQQQLRLRDVNSSNADFYLARLLQLRENQKKEVDMEDMLSKEEIQSAIMLANEDADVTTQSDKCTSSTLETAKISSTSAGDALVVEEMEEEESRKLYLQIIHQHQILKKEDKDHRFSYPITDSMAPLYSKIIKHPMDFQTMYTKIRNGVYRSVADYMTDFDLMISNCKTYNHPNSTIYRAAKRLAAFALGLDFKFKDNEKPWTFLPMNYLAKFRENEFSLSGFNWGQLVFNGIGRTFDFKLDQKMVFELPLTNILLSATTGNEVVIQFKPNDKDPVSLMEMIFDIPSNATNQVDQVVKFMKNIKQEPKLTSPVNSPTSSPESEEALLDVDEPSQIESFGEELNEEMKQKLSDILKGHKVSHRSASLQPRGLKNGANWCYVNATLQALLACPPFFHLFKLLPPLDGSYPVMKCLRKFVNEFSAMKQAINLKGTRDKQEIMSGASFKPVYIHKMLQTIDYEAFKHNQQEDAEEFLSFILNRLHEEMLAAIKLTNAAASSEIKNTGLDGSNGQSLDVQRSSVGEETDDNARWEQVGSRIRTVFNSTADTESSPISSIFRGQICCILHQAGQKESATLQPFFTLQLDVQSDKVHSVQDALEQLVSKESLLGYTCSKSKVEVDATQRTMIEALPPVLVLHLKWFIHDKNGGIQKCIKQVDFDVDLELSKDLLSDRVKLQRHQRKYKLFAVVNHIGDQAIRGHYMVDVFHSGYNCWIRCDDDNKIEGISVSDVTKFCAPQVPYLLFYQRLDAS